MSSDKEIMMYREEDGITIPLSRFHFGPRENFRKMTIEEVNAIGYFEVETE